MSKIIGVYMIENIINNKKYIGQSINIFKRKNQHFNNALNGSKKCCVLYNAIRKYGEDKFKFSILEECSIEELNEKEKLWIKNLNTIEPNGYNLLDGGGEKTKVHESTKEKISKFQKGRKKTKEEIDKIKAGVQRKYNSGWVSPNKGKKLKGKVLDNLIKRNKSRKGISAWNKGIPFSEESKNKMSESRKGKVLTQDTKNKIKIKMTGRKITWGDKISEARLGHEVTKESRKKISETQMRGYVIKCSNGKVYKTTMEAAEDTGASGTNIAAVCAGRRKSANGYTFTKEKI